MFMQLLDKVSKGNDTIGSWVGKVMNAVDKILVPVLIIACSVGMIWAIVIGIKRMKAEDSKAREENKAKLINIAISIVAIAVLIGLFYALRNWLDDTSVKGDDFNIFDKKIYAAETQTYRKQLNAYGTPLDYRRAFTKTDWMLWAACLDESNENIATFSKCICNYLRDTKDRNCFTDWYETKEPKQSGFDHRTVQAGLWMPVLRDKLKEIK